jgi:hypothetical protein
MLSLHGASVSENNPGGNEHGVRIFKDQKTGKYTHGNAVEGDLRSVDVQQAPEPDSSARGTWEQAGWNHTHPGTNDPDKPVDKQDPFSYSETEAVGDKAATQMGQFAGLAEFTTGNVFVYEQITEFPDYALDGTDPRSSTFDFNKFKTEGTVDYVGNVQADRPAQEKKPVIEDTTEN